MAPGEEIELAKTGIEQVGETGREFARIVSNSSGGRELFDWFADWVRGRRLQTQLRILKRAEKAVNDAGLPPQAVPRKLLVPLLEWGGLEDDDDMVTRWANLLANAATPSEADVHTSYPDILRQLEAVEALILDFLFEQMGDRPPLGPRLSRGSAMAMDEQGWPPSYLADQAGLEEGALKPEHVENLVRLGLCRHPIKDFAKFARPSAREPELRDRLEDRNQIKLSPLGYDFVRACRSPLQSTVVKEGDDEGGSERLAPS